MLVKNFSEFSQLARVCVVPIRLFAPFDTDSGPLWHPFQPFERPLEHALSNPLEKCAVKGEFLKKLAHWPSLFGTGGGHSNSPEVTEHKLLDIT